MRTTSIVFLSYKMRSATIYSFVDVSSIVFIRYFSNVLCCTLHVSFDHQHE